MTFHEVGSRFQPSSKISACKDSVFVPSIIKEMAHGVPVVPLFRSLCPGLSAAALGLHGCRVWTVHVSSRRLDAAIFDSRRTTTAHDWQVARSLRQGLAKLPRESQCTAHLCICFGRGGLKTLSLPQWAIRGRDYLQCNRATHHSIPLWEHALKYLQHELVTVGKGLFWNRPHWSTGVGLKLVTAKCGYTVVSRNSLIELIVFRCRHPSDLMLLEPND